MLTAKKALLMCSQISVNEKHTFKMRKKNLIFKADAYTYLEDCLTTGIISPF